MAMVMAEMWAQIGTLLGSIMFVYTMVKQYCSHHLRTSVRRYTHKLTTLVYPYIQITFHEYTENRFRRSEAYTAVLTYLNENCSQKAKRLKAEVVADSQTPLVLSIDDNEEVTDEFHGVKVWWAARKTTSRSFSFYPASDEKIFLTLTFHERCRDLITGSYLKHVLDEGKAITKKNRQLKLYTNNPSGSWGGYNSSEWSHKVFEHPATFKTLAMVEKKNEKIIKDFVKFKSGKEYYSKIKKGLEKGILCGKTMRYFKTFFQF